jgi:excisionase family DNA binding protein
MRYDISLASTKETNASPRLRPKDGGRLLTVQQAADYLGTTASTLYSKVWRREIPFIKLGRSVRFDLADLDKLIEQSKVKPFELLEPSVQFRK